MAGGNRSYWRKKGPAGDINTASYTTETAIGPDGKPLVSSGTNEALLITNINNDYDPEFLSLQLTDYTNLSS